MAILQDHLVGRRRRVVVAGGSGFLGRACVRELVAHGFDVVVLSRSAETQVSGATTVLWNGRDHGVWAHALEGAYALINFSGKSINCRFTPANRRALLASRIAPVQALGRAVAACTQPPMVWIQAASPAIYGDMRTPCTEADPAGHGFLAQLCQRWEQAFALVPLTARTRRVVLRIGLVLAADGGALPPLVRLTRMGLGATIGGGRQWMSWIHLADFNAMLLQALADAQVRGVYNATAPAPVPNVVFMHALRQVLHRPSLPSWPTPLVQLGGWLLGTDPLVILQSQHCVPQRWLDHGFAFAYPKLADALRQILG